MTIMLRHRLTHRSLEERSFKCTVCYRVMVNENSLKNHMKTHETTKEHVCDVCGMSFPTSWVLKVGESSTFSEFINIRMYFSTESQTNAQHRPSVPVQTVSKVVQNLFISLRAREAKAWERVSGTVQYLRDCGADKGEKTNCLKNIVAIILFFTEISVSSLQNHPHRLHDYRKCVSS